jgi:7-cyano-7-deazaguanine reductase
MVSRQARRVKDRNAGGRETVFQRPARFLLVTFRRTHYTCVETRNENQGMSESGTIEMFDNPCPGRDYRITIRCPEFTSVCPKTGQPDFGEIIVEYCPDRQCIELKSLKLYMQGYRNRGIFYEALTNGILDDLSGACKPRWMKVTARFTPRGGITTDVAAEYRAQG